MRTDSPYRILFEKNPQPMWVYDLKTLQFLAVNAAAINHYGYSENEFLSMTIRDICTSEDIERLEEAVRRVQRSQVQNFSRNWRHKKKNGEVVTVEIAGSPLRWNGRPAELIAAHDVTTRVKVEENILAARANLRAIVGSTDQIIWSVDRNLGCVASNVAFHILFEKAFGRKPHEGMQVGDVLPSAEASFWTNCYRRGLKGERFSIEGPFPVDAETRYFKITFSPIEVGAIVTGVTMSAMDVTEARKQEAQKEQLVLDLGERIKELQLLHDAARLLQNDDQNIGDVLRTLTERLPRAFLHSDIAEARIVYCGERYSTAGFKEDPQSLREEFVMSDGTSGSLEVMYRESRPPRDIGPFLREEVELLDSLSELMKSYFERRSLKAELARTNEWFRTIFEASRDGIMVELDATIVYVNSAYVKLYGYDSSDKLVGRHVSIVQSESDDRRLLEYGRRRLEGQSVPSLYEFQGKRKDGTLVELEASVSTSVINGKTYIVALERDIRDRKASERALEESEERYRRFFQDDLSGNFISTPDGRLIACNPAFARIFGFSSVEEALMADAKKLYTDADEREQYLTRLKAEKRIEGMGRTMRCTDGTEIDTISNVSGEFDENGRLLFIKGHVLDVTDQKRAYQRLEEQAVLLDIMRDAMIVWRIDDTITLWNRGAEQMYGRSRTEAVGRRVTDLLSESEMPVFQEAKRMVLERGQWNGEYEQTTKNGRPLMVESRWTLIRDEGGRPHSILVVDTDVTEQREFQKQFMRTQRLESLGTLAGGIAHDLNNVLGPILMGTEVLKKRSTDSSSLKLLESMGDSAKRGAEMVKQVLSFARGLDGKRVLVQTKHIVQEIITFVSETFPKSIEIRKDIHKNVPPVIGDATQIHQILLNLAVNARDAMSDGGSLTFGLSMAEIDEHYSKMHPDATPGMYVVLSVRDTGTGIAPEILDRIFDPFFTTKAQGQGTGLGLSMAMGIAHGHGGYIDVYSERGKGSEFKVYLPATSAGEETNEVEDQRTDRGHGETILFVEDEPSICDASGIILETNGYEVLTAKDGTEAVALYARHKDVIRMMIVDMSMPVMNGPATVRAVHYLNPDLPVIACSGLFVDADQLGPSVKGFLQKPFNGRQLLSAVRAALETD